MAVIEPQWLKYKTTDDRQSTFAVYAVFTAGAVEERMTDLVLQTILRLQLLLACETDRVKCVCVTYD